MQIAPSTVSVTTLRVLKTTPRSETITKPRNKTVRRSHASTMVSSPVTRAAHPSPTAARAPAAAAMSCPRWRRTETTAAMRTAEKSAWSITALGPVSRSGPTRSAPTTAISSDRKAPGRVMGVTRRSFLLSRLRRQWDLGPTRSRTAGPRAALGSRCDHESESGFRPIVSGKGLPDVPAGELLILSRGLEQLVEADAAVVEGRQTTLPELRRLQHLVEEVRHLLFGYGELVGRRPLLGEDGVHLLDRRRQRRCLPGVGRSDRRERSEPWIDEGRLGRGADAVDELLVLAEDLRHPSAEHARGQVEKTPIAHVAEVGAEEAGQDGALGRERIDRFPDADRPLRSGDLSERRECLVADAWSRGQRAEVLPRQTRGCLKVHVADDGNLGRGLRDEVPEPGLRGRAGDCADLLGGQRLRPHFTRRVDGRRA